MVSVLLADDHPLILRGLVNLFNGCADLHVVGEEFDGPGTLDAINRIQPNILVMDLMMPGMSGMELIRRAALVRPDMGIVVLSMHANIAYVWEALRNGARAYVLKCSEGEELPHAVREVHAGRRYLSSAISTQELDGYAHSVQRQNLGPDEMLTKRERQVLRLVAEGHTSARIAQQLHIGVRTVETYRANLLLKLNLHNHTDLIRYAIQRGIIAPL